jgi:hypothetical protein
LYRKSVGRCWQVLAGVARESRQPNAPLAREGGEKRETEVARQAWNLTREQPKFYTNISPACH